MGGGWGGGLNQTESALRSSGTIRSSSDGWFFFVFDFVPAIIYTKRFIDGVGDRVDRCIQTCDGFMEKQRCQFAFHVSVSRAHSFIILIHLETNWKIGLNHLGFFFVETKIQPSIAE